MFASFLGTAGAQQAIVQQGAAGQTSSASSHFLVALDAAHGGQDTGAKLSDRLYEKNFTLAFTTRLRAALASKGMQVVVTRDTDSVVPVKSRAAIANHGVAAACLSLHATATGSGIHLFTSSLSQTQPTHFLPWLTAQSAYITKSLKLSSELNAALAHSQIPVTLARTSLQPIDSFSCPSVAIEIAPLAPVQGKSGMSLDSAEYQEKVIDSIAAALVAWRNEWRQQF